MAKHELYFGYASSLSVRKMKERGAEFLTRESAILRGYRLMFNCKWKEDEFGYATIVRDEKSVVCGALYKCKAGSMASLDREYVHEGGCFCRMVVRVETGEGKAVNAFTYSANEGYAVEGLTPSAVYLNTILEGEDILPEDYLKFLRSFRDD